MNFFEIASFGIHESFFMGIFHGILFSFPLSIPFLISLRYFLLKGLSFGFTSLFGILCGQFVFFVILCSGIRPLILLWYSIEPILAFVGVGLTFQLATNFYHQKRFFDISLSGGRAVIDPKFTRVGQVEAMALQRGAQASPLGRLQSLLGSVMHLQIFEKARHFSFDKIKIFFFQFCLIFLNPVFPALSTRIILSQDILTHFSLLYASGFFIGSVLCVGGFLFFLRSLYFLFTEAQVPTFATSSGGIRSALFSVDIFSQFINNCFVFCILGLLFHGSFQYTWRFITYYPFEFFSIPMRGHTETSPEGFIDLATELRRAELQGGQSRQSQSEAYANPTPHADQGQSPRVGFDTADQGQSPRAGVGFATAERSVGFASAKSITVPYFSEFLRDFPTQDSNIRHREKTLPVERHLPIERINLRRNLSGRPPLNEEQKSDANTKYNSFFLNKIENIFENFKIRSRENIRVNLLGGEAELRSSASQRRSLRYALQSLRPPYAERGQLRRRLLHQNRGEARATLGSGETYATFLENPAVIETNKAKGKPQFSYIRHLFYPQAKPTPLTSNVSFHEIALNPYIHDDLSVYYTLSKDGGDR